MVLSVFKFFTPKFQIFVKSQKVVPSQHGEHNIFFHQTSAMPKESKRVTLKWSTASAADLEKPCKEKPLMDTSVNTTTSDEIDANIRCGH